MKKLTAILLAVMTAFALAACSGNNVNTETEASKPESKVDSTGTEADSSDSSQTDSSSEPLDDDSSDTAKVLVAYFSATNSTEGVAKNDRRQHRSRSV